MNTNKAVYWTALAAVALGLSSEYQRNGSAALCSVAEHAGMRLSQLSTQAEHALLALGVLPTHGHSFLVRESVTEQADQVERSLDLHQAEFDRAMARREAELEQAQAQMVRAQAILMRANLGRLQVREMPHFKMINGANHHVITICPRNGRKIRIEAGPETADVDTDVPDIEVGDQF